MDISIYCIDRLEKDLKEKICFTREKDRKMDDLRKDIW